MTRSNNYKPFMAYFEPKEYLRLKKFAKDVKTPMAQILREAVAQRMSLNNRRCMTVEEMRGRGMDVNAAGFWVTELFDKTRRFKTKEGDHV